MWNKLIQPSGNFVIIGEAASPHRGCVVGVLESAVHGLHTWLKMNRNIPRAKEAVEFLERADVENPIVGLPPYKNPEISA